jgi:hypothetical protein
MNRSVETREEQRLAPVAAIVVSVCVLVNIAAGIEGVSEPLARARVVWARVQRVASLVERALDDGGKAAEIDADADDDDPCR